VELPTPAVFSLTELRVELRDMNCWICGRPADSGEHKIKRSLLVKVFGPGPYHGPNELLHVIGSESRAIKGPGARQLKFEDAICSKCNSTGTQAFDNAYDKFTDYVIANATTVVARRVVDFADVFGSDFATKQRDLYKYFVKLFGCHLRVAGHPVPPDRWRLLPLDYFQTGLVITFTVNEDKLPMFNSSIGCPAGLGDLYTTQRNLTQKDDPQFAWSIYFAYLHVFFWYDWTPIGPTGARWTADSQYIYLGWMTPLNPEQRAKLAANIARDHASDSP
jgi:hypothetical protein